MVHVQEIFARTIVLLACNSSVESDDVDNQCIVPDGIYTLSYEHVVVSEVFRHVQRRMTH